ncbi:glycosyltransferase family 2 protein [Chlorogloeopsis fritschii]|nr:glycosyltransferase family 2 protein [Chlorogloeopsis fritschii]
MSIKQISYCDKVTIVLPVHNEEANLLRLIQEIDACFQSDAEIRTLPYLLFVDDGSSDGSLECIRTAISERGHASCLRFSRNFGHQAAVMAGISYAPENSIVVVMDSDGQDPPIIALDLVHHVMNGADVAYGVRWRREGRNWIKRFAYWSFYRLLSSLSIIKIPLDAGDFCAYSPRTIKILSQLKEKHPYIRGLRAWIGLNQVGVPYKRPERYAGQASYNFRGLFKLAFDGILSFSVKPLRLSIALGFITFFICLFLGVFYLTAYFYDWHFSGLRMRDIPGFTTLILMILATSSLQMLMLGVIGEYLGRLFEESKGRPLFIIAETLGNLNRGKSQGND